MSEGERKFFYTPRDALGFLIREAKGAVVIDPFAREHSPQETLLIEEAQAKIEGYAEKKYSPKKTWEKLTSELNFKQFAYLISSQHMVLKQYKESKIRSGLSRYAIGRIAQLQDFKYTDQRTIYISLPLEKSTLIDREIHLLDELVGRLESPGVYKPESLEKSYLKKRARR